MEVDETKVKIYARFNNQVSRDIDRVPPFFFLLSRFESVSPSYSSVLRDAPRLSLTIFLRLMRGKRAI